MKRFSARLAVASLLLGSSSLLAQTPPPGELPDTARPLSYRIDLIVDPAKDRFSGETSIDIEVKSRTDTLFIHGNELKVARVEARTGGEAANVATYTQPLTTGVVQLKFARPLAPGRHTLFFSYDAPFRTGAEGLYHVQVGDDWYAWTQMEPLDARRMFPSFDEPRHKVPFTVSITAPTGQKTFANTPLTRSTPAAGGMVRHEFAPSKPLPTYLVAIAVGPFDEAQATVPANGVRKAPLTLRHIATKGQAARLTYGVQETPKILAMLEDYFGIPYPYEKLDQIASPAMGGAMENAGLVTYDDTLLLLDADAPLSQRRGFGTVVAHELSHQWFGNLVTPRWWDDIWLNESFAEWMGNKIATQWQPEIGAGPAQLVGALDAMSGDSRAVGRPIRQPISRNEDVSSAFDSITYEKGGQVLEMVEAYLGKEKFRQGVQAHLRRFPYGTATAEDFFQSIGSAGGDPRVVRAFQSFVTQQGVPLIEVRRGTNGNYLLTQQRYRPIGVAAGTDQSWIVPFCARSGAQRACTLLEGKEGRLALGGDAGSTWVLPNAGAAGYYRFDLDADGWQRLIGAAPALSGEEAMVVADSAWASFEAGRAPLATALAAMAAFAGNEERLAATHIPGNLQLISQTLMNAADREGYQRLMARLFAPRLSELGLNLSRGAYASENADRSELRQTLAGYVASEGRDKTVRQQLVAAAEASLAGDEAALDPAYRQLAFATAVQDRGLPFMNRLLEALLPAQDPLFRRHAAAALGSADTPELAKRALAVSDDSRLQNLERIYILFWLLQQESTRDLAFNHVMANFDTVQPLFSGFGNAILTIGSGYCSEEKAQMVDSALRPKLGMLGGGELDLERSLASIRQCAALKQAKGPEISAALAAAR
jgi:aminopeptidase N